MSKWPKVAMIGNYLPRKCGIATFTTDLSNALGAEAPELELSVVAMNDTREGYRYPERVRFQIAQNRQAEYHNAADFLNITNFEVANVQHEYGIFGGPAGGLLLVMMRDLRMPIVTTLHTVLKEPNEDQQRVMEEIVALSDRVIVMSRMAKALLIQVYHAPEDKIVFIPHGVADMPFVDPNLYKDRFGVGGRKVVLTCGLLSRNKGLEHMINALPRVIKRHEDVVYVVVGATHPVVVRQEGEEYRFYLQRLVRSLGLDEHVIFHDRFVEFEELKAFLGSADICVTPYLNERQMTSGVLALCMGAGTATVSTPYWYAEELLGDGRGVLVPFADSNALGDAVLALLDSDLDRQAMRKRAYLYGRQMVWTAVARQYLQLYHDTLENRTVAPGRYVSESRQLSARTHGAPAIKLTQLLRMSDSTGLLQHAKYTVPDRSHGYCTDDNARALVFAVRAANLLGEEAAELNSLASTYLSFLDHAMVPESGRFHNFMSYDRRWLDRVGSDDCQGRAMWALGAVAAYGGESGLVGVATRLFNEALRATESLVAPRGVALALIGIHEYLKHFSGDVAAHRAREKLAGFIFERFGQNATREWPWPEKTLTYINARLPHALLLSGRWMHRGDMMETALGALEFLLRVQTSPQGYFEPVGCKGWYSMGGVKAAFDQQPIEAESTLAACIAAWRVTRDEKWLDRARLAYEWFLGRNTLGASLYDHLTGGCRDGLQADGVNQNEGAESTLAWLLSAVAMEEVKTEAGTRGKRPREHQQILLV